MEQLEKTMVTKIIVRICCQGTKQALANDIWVDYYI
jgi:hypothetical protein